jgi:hypothetical protein
MIKQDQTHHFPTITIIAITTITANITASQ